MSYTCGYIILFSLYVTHAFDSWSLLLASFLLQLIQASLTNNMPKFLFPPLNRFLAELGLRGLRVPFSFLGNFLPYLPIIHIITHTTRFIKYKYRIFFPSIQPSHGRLLMSIGYWFFFGNFACFLSHVKNHPRGVGWRFYLFVDLLWLVRWSRHLVIDCGLLGNRMYWSYQRFAGKGLVVVREGISTPNAPYLR